MSRDWSELHRQVCFGESRGKIIWQPRIGCWFHDKLFEQEAFPAPFTDMTWEEIYRELDCSARLYSHYNPCFKAVYPDNIRFFTRQINETDTESGCETPKGTLSSIRRRVDSSRAQLRVKAEVETEEDLRIATWRESLTEWRWDQGQYDRMQEAVGDLGAPTMYLPRITIQDLYINKMTTERAIYAVHDWPDTVQAYFRTLDDSHDRLIDVVNASPIDIINFGDNLHVGTLPPDFYRRHVLPSYLRRTEKLHHAGKFICSHWDGDVRGLLPFARSSGLDGVEAITPAPQGDVSLEETKEALGDDVFLIDGIPAIYFDDIFSVGVLEECVGRIIELFAPKLILGISDEISSTGDIERVRLVRRLVDDYNATVD